MPITAPPLKATESALLKLFLAASVVLWFANVATLIPKAPAKPLHIAPTIKDSATSVVPDDMFTQYKSAATVKTNIVKTLYSLTRKAVAPSRIAKPISCIFSFPGFWSDIHLLLINPNTTANKPDSGIK